MFYVMLCSVFTMNSACFILTESHGREAAARFDVCAFASKPTLCAIAKNAKRIRITVICGPLQSI